MCYQKEERLLGKRDLSLNEIKEVLDNMPSLKRASLIGSEIFMRKDIFEVIEEFSRRKIKLYLTTNGTLINQDNIKKLGKFKNTIRGIGFSLDGLKDTHNKIRGANIFDKVIESINLVKNDFNVSVNSVMMENNFDELYDLFKLLNNVGVVNFGLTMEMFSTSEELALSRNILHDENLQIAMQISKNPTYNFSLQKLQETIEKIRSIKGINVVIHPDIFDYFPEELYDGKLRERAKLICKNMFVGRISAQGDMIFCPFIKKSFGNLREEALEKIWNNNQFKSFRKELVKNNLLPVCKRCCKLGLSVEDEDEKQDSIV
jgi:radical SAM protein with 4Fe4S-binding SPASM domain